MANNQETKVTFRAVNKEFNKAMSEMKSESATLRKEFVLQQAQLQQTGTESEKLATKLDYLKKVEQLTTQQVAKTEEQYNKIKETYGENSVEAQKMAQKLLDVQIAHQKLSNDINKTEQSITSLEASQRKLQTLLDATETSLDDFSDSLGNDLVQAIKNGTATSSQLEQAISRIGKEALGADTDLGRMQKALKSLDDGASIEQISKDLRRVAQEAGEAQESVSDFGGELENVIAGISAGGGIAGTIAAALDTSSLKTQIEVNFEVPEESKATVKEAIKGVEAYGVDAEAALAGVKRQWYLNKDATDETNAAVVQGAATIAFAYRDIDFNELIQEANEIGASFKISNQEALGLVYSLLKIGFPPDQLDIISEYGTQLKMAGYTAEEIQNIFAAGVDTKSWNIDNLLDGIKEGRIKMAEFGAEIPKSLKEALEGTTISTKQMQAWGEAVAKGGETGKQAMSEVAKALVNVRDETKRNELGVQIFGTLYEDQGENILDVLINAEKGTADLKKGTEQLGEATNKINADPMVMWSKALSDMKNALTPVLIKVSEFVSKMALWISENPKLAASIAAVTAVLGIILGAAAALIPVFLSISTYLTVMGAKFTQATVAQRTYTASTIMMGSASAGAAAKTTLLSRALALMGGPFRLRGKNIIKREIKHN